MSKTRNPIIITTVSVSITTPEIPISDYMRLYALKQGVQPTLIDKVITCESNWKNVQSNLYNKYRGHREMSFGIAQINLISHPEITKKDALNERFAVHYLITEIAKGKGNQWTCFREINNPHNGDNL